MADRPRRIPLSGSIIAAVWQHLQRGTATTYLISEQSRPQATAWHPGRAASGQRTRRM